MAKLTQTTKKVTKTVEVDEPVIILELSKEEATVLSVLTGNVGGGGKIRQITDNLYHALGDFLPEDFSNMFRGNVYIKDYAEDCLK